MIDYQTARDIALAYREIETAETLLEKIQDALDRRTVPDLRDAFGRPTQGLQLGVPTSATGQTLFNVPWEIARPVIEAHIARQKGVIAALCEKARIELGP